jgi:hypothetical protein
MARPTETLPYFAILQRQMSECRQFPASEKGQEQNHCQNGTVILGSEQACLRSGAPDYAKHVLVI